MTDYDITVVGCGPGGASAAYFSKLFDEENSKRVLALERLSGENFSRYHRMCGEAVSHLIEEDLSNIDILKFSENEIEKVLEYYGGGSESKIESKFSGYILDRPKFLKKMIKDFKKMGGEFKNDAFIKMREGKESIKIKLNSGETIETEYLVIATGPNKTVEKFPGRLKKQSSRTVLYQILLDEMPERRDSIEFYYDEKYSEDYRWKFPYQDKTKIGLPDICKEELSSYPEEKVIRVDTKQVASGLLKSYNHGNTLFVGDAAFQTNPLTKGGIRPAINAGKMAAESLVKYADPDKYDIMWKKSGFHDELYLKAVNMLRKMDNEELINYSSNLKYYPFSLPLILLKYRKYLPLYKVEFLSKKYGW